MHLIQLLLPVYDGRGERFPQPHYDAVAAELTRRFGGLTAYVRAPATGLWRPRPDGHTERDEIVVFEVMAERIDPDWWAQYRRELERCFDQDELVIRAQEIRRL